jgi:hypothetical protein
MERKNHTANLHDRAKALDMNAVLDSMRKKMMLFTSMAASLKGNERVTYLMTMAHALGKNYHQARKDDDVETMLVQFLFFNFASSLAMMTEKKSVSYVDSDTDSDGDSRPYSVHHHPHPAADTALNATPDMQWKAIKGRFVGWKKIWPNYIPDSKKPAIEIKDMEMNAIVNQAEAAILAAARLRFRSWNLDPNTYSIATLRVTTDLMNRVNRTFPFRYMNTSGEGNSCMVFALFTSIAFAAQISLQFGTDIMGAATKFKAESVSTQVGETAYPTIFARYRDLLGFNMIHPDMGTNHAIGSRTGNDSMSKDIIQMGRIFMVMCQSLELMTYHVGLNPDATRLAVEPTNPDFNRTDIVNRLNRCEMEISHSNELGRRLWFNMAVLTATNTYRTGTAEKPGPYAIPYDLFTSDDPQGPAMTSLYRGSHHLKIIIRNEAVNHFEPLLPMRFFTNSQIQVGEELYLADSKSDQLTYTMVH